VPFGDGVGVQDVGFAARTADGDKVVWADLAVPAKPLTPAGLPRRVREHAASAAPGAGLVRDPALPRRVHRALRNL
jgi:hypothetical protein